MASKSEINKSTETFTFVLDHTDIIDMMNDPQVLIDGGNVGNDQVVSIHLKRPNKSELFLKRMGPNDKILFKFNKVSSVKSDDAFVDVDVE